MRDFKFFTEKRQPTVETAAEILEETFISEVVKRTYQRMPACHPCMRSVLFAVVPCVEAP